MSIGFTGTRNGITEMQAATLEQVLRVTKLNVPYSERVFHHGDCIGADDAAHIIAKRLGFYIVVHPPKVEMYRAFCRGDEIRPEHDYMIRNHNIVGETKYLIACPSTGIEELRSGTWATVRAAQKSRKQVMLIPPHGIIDWL